MSAKVLDQSRRRFSGNQDGMPALPRQRGCPKSMHWKPSWRIGPSSTP